MKHDPLFLHIVFDCHGIATFDEQKHEIDVLGGNMSMDVTHKSVSNLNDIDQT